MKLYKVAAEKRLRQQQDIEIYELVRLGIIKYDDVEKQRALYKQGNSRLGDQLSESTTRRVIIMILIMLIILPLLLYFPNNNGREFGTKMLHNFNLDDTLNSETKQYFLDQFITIIKKNYDSRYIVLLNIEPYNSINITNPYLLYESNLDSLRENAKYIENFSNTDSSNVFYNTYIIYNLTSLVRQNATFSILMTIFVAIMMIGGSLIFTNDAQRLVIAPIERMTNMVEAVAADPLAPLHFDHSNEKGNSAGQYETRLLEKTIEKITGKYSIVYSVFIV